MTTTPPMQPSSASTSIAPASPSPTPTTVRKVRTSAYVLDKAKIARMLAIIEQRFSEKQMQFLPQFNIKLKSEKTISLSLSNELFTVDNALKNPIVELAIITADRTHSLRPQVSISFDSDNTSNVALTVICMDSKWANEVFAELEEQVERTLINDWMKNFFRTESFLSFLTFLTFLTFLPLLLGIVAAGDSSLTIPESGIRGSLSAEVSRNLLDQAGAATSNDEKMQFIFEYNRAQLEAVQRTNMPTINWQGLLNLNTFFIALPAVIIIGCIVYLLKYCYPKSVFLWGDWEDNYNKILSRRQFLWTVVIASIILGIVTNLFIIGVSSFLTSR